MTMPKLGSIPTPILDELQALLARAVETSAQEHEISMRCGGLSREAHNARRDNQAAEMALRLKLPRLLPPVIAAARQLEEVRRDAERYHVLCGGGVPGVVVFEKGGRPIGGTELDSLCDAAFAKSSKKEL